MKGKRILLIGSVCLALILITLPLMSACKGEEAVTPVEEEEEEELETWQGIFNTDMSFVDPSAQITLEMYDAIAEATDGRVTFDCHFGGELYSEISALDALSTGEIVCTNVYPFVLNEWDRRWDLFQMPFLFEDEPHADQFATRCPEYRDLVFDLEKFDMTPFPWYTWQRGVFAFYIFSNFSIHTMEDLAGKKVRCQESPINLRMFELLGAQGVPVAYEEVSTALSTGMVDGLVGCEGESWAAVYGIYDYCTAKLLTPVNIQISWDMWNKTWWESIDEDVRYTILEVIDYYYGLRGHIGEYLVSAPSIEHSNEVLDVTALSADEIVRWKEVLEPLYADFCAEVEGAREIIDAIPPYREYGI